MKIHQFYDEYLAHASYAILSQTTGEVLLVDPGRNPQPYYDWAKANNGRIAAVVETHPHADFVSSHLEIAQTTGAIILQSDLTEPEYEFVPFDDGDRLELGECTYLAINTPGHSPDSICVALYVKEALYALFTGDTLFVGDVGRPDLRENVGNLTAARQDLARQLYYSTREKIMNFPPETLVYPAHGAGSLCGKNLSKERFSTIGQELEHNPALAPMSESEFVNYVLTDQPFVPVYFEYDVELNKKGAAKLAQSLYQIPRILAETVQKNVWIIDTRPERLFKKDHLPHSINLMQGGKFETWLGSILTPGEPFYLVAIKSDVMNEMVERTAKIGYETAVKGIFFPGIDGLETTPLLDITHFADHETSYTIVDIRNSLEVVSGKIFDSALAIPLSDLRARARELPLDKPIVVHCAGGYRSAAGSSLLQALLPDATVYDLGEAVTQFHSTKAPAL